MLGGASSSGSELANSGGGGMKGMALSLCSSCPGGDADVGSLGFFTTLLFCADWEFVEGP